jgi:hypothetical protein
LTKIMPFSASMLNVFGPAGKPPRPVKPDGWTGLTDRASPARLLKK